MPYARRAPPPTCPTPSKDSTFTGTPSSMPNAHQLARTQKPIHPLELSQRGLQWMHPDYRPPVTRTGFNRRLTPAEQQHARALSAEIKEKSSLTASQTHRRADHAVRPKATAATLSSAFRRLDGSRDPILEIHQLGRPKTRLHPLDLT